MCGYFEAFWERIQNWKKNNVSFFPQEYLKAAAEYFI